MITPKWLYKCWCGGRFIKITLDVPWQGLNTPLSKITYYTLRCNKCGYRHGRPIPKLIRRFFNV